MKRIALVLCIALLSLSVFAQTGPAEKSVTLTFIETSDIHGAIYPYDFVNAKPMATSLAQVASLIAEERAANPNVVLLDNGDSLQGQPTVYYYNFEKTAGPHIWSQALNFLKYDAIGVGNHDIEAGHTVYDKLYEETQAAVLCANAVKPDGSPYFTPYSIVEKGGVKIAILGLVSPKIPDWLPPQFWTGMEFEDMVESAKKWVPIIQEKESTIPTATSRRIRNTTRTRRSSSPKWFPASTSSSSATTTRAGTAWAGTRRRRKRSR